MSYSKSSKPKSTPVPSLRDELPRLNSADNCQHVPEPGPIALGSARGRETDETSLKLNLRKIAKATKLTLPCFTLHEVCQASDERATRFKLKHAGRHFDHCVRTVLIETGSYVNHKPVEAPVQFNLYPVVRTACGVPWPEANLYILMQVMDKKDPSMLTFDGIASDLAAYRIFLDTEGIDWKRFPKHKLSRPTYRYSAYLSDLVDAKQLAPSSASRRVSAAIAFYRWLAASGVFVPQHEPWKNRDILLNLTTTYGGKVSKTVTTTDISLKIPKDRDPYGGTIEDGGRLRPLSLEEQNWILEALFAIGNTEMTLIHLLALTTGARIQTVLTFTLQNLRKLSIDERNAAPGTEIRCPAGPGTYIDTKKNKRGSLFIPLWVHGMLETYAMSDRAARRRSLSRKRDPNVQNLFLTKSGAPFYSRKDEDRIFDADNTRRFAIRGQAIRTFKTSAIIPYVRSRHDKSFWFKFHDLRASFGMNLTDTQLLLVAQKMCTLSEARQFVAERMWHSSAAITDGYLDFRVNLKHVQQVQDSYDDHLRLMVKKAGLL